MDSIDDPLEDKTYLQKVVKASLGEKYDIIEKKEEDETTLPGKQIHKRQDSYAIFLDDLQRSYEESPELEGLLSQNSQDLSALISPNTSITSQSTKTTKHKRRVTLANEMSLLKEMSFIGNEEIEFKMNLFNNNSMQRRQTCSDRFSF